MNQQEVYIPLLTEYCRQNEEAILNSKYPYIPFIPVAFKNYEMSNPKIFYVGLDTYYWNKSLQKMLDCYKQGSLSEILAINNSEVTPERILQDWYCNKGLFWNFVCKLHLYIRTGKILNNEKLRHLSMEEVNFIKEIGWGNMNCIELQRTLKKEDVWDDIDHKKYWELKNYSQTIIDPIINIIQAYNPDYIILLGWGDNEDHVFKGLKYEAKDDFFEKDYRALYILRDYNTKIIWTSHPSRFSRISTNQDEMIPYIGDSIKLFK